MIAVSQTASLNDESYPPGRREPFVGDYHLALATSGNATVVAGVSVDRILYVLSGFSSIKKECRRG